ncbi:MAG: hypothetical protein V7L21_08530 [Nostoc sp.]|uniref:hypothetical protein n=1 Tax=Nostoc sp. TaxID=1180 RepID=UPI002FF74B27
MNIQLAHQKVREFLTIRVKIDAWDLDIPELHSPTSNNYQPGTSAIALPIQNLVHKRAGLNLIETSVRFPYRITYRFPFDLAYDALPFSGLEGVISTIHLLASLQLPDENIKSFQPAEVEDSVTVERIAQEDGDWLVNLNFAFDVVFNTTDFPDISSIQPADYYNIENPPSLSEITIRVNRAKPEFIKSNTSTYVEDSTINIIK